MRKIGVAVGLSPSRVCEIKENLGKDRYDDAVRAFQTREREQRRIAREEAKQRSEVEERLTREEERIEKEREAHGVSAVCACGAGAVDAGDGDCLICSKPLPTVGVA